MRMRFLRISPLLVGALTLATAGVLPRPAAGQTPFVPYFGKNQVRYDRFDWHIYKTDHFEIFYYPAARAAPRAGRRRTPRARISTSARS